MDRIEVEGFEQAAGAGGGQALILLRRVARLGRNVRFRLRPADAEVQPPEASEIFTADHVPLAVTETEEGVALAIDPALAASPHLRPGAWIEIELPDEELVGRLRWPAFGRAADRAGVGGAGGDGLASARPANTTTRLASAMKVPAAPPLPEPEIRRESLRPGPERAGTVARVTDHAQNANGGSNWPRTLSPGSAAALTAAALLIGGFLVLSAFDLALVKRSGIAVPPPRSAPIPTPEAKPHAPGVYESLAAGPVSPRGVRAETVSPAKALQLAHGLLHGPEGQRDPEEAIYWLKRYLAVTTGGEEARIALTQLGSAYARPVRGSSDITSARIAWELAAALGDPVAMCFLSALYASGIGVAPDRAAAVVWLDRAGAAGGACVTSSETGSRGRK